MLRKENLCMGGDALSILQYDSIGCNSDGRIGYDGGVFNSESYGGRLEKILVDMDLIVLELMNRNRRVLL